MINDLICRIERLLASQAIPWSSWYRIALIVEIVTLSGPISMIMSPSVIPYNLNTRHGNSR